MRRIDLVVGGQAVPFYRVADPDKVLDDVAAEADLRQRLNGRRVDDKELHLPYWAELWDSAVALVAALALESNVAWGRGLSVLDLGCGMGAAGAGAIALGHRVLLADLEADALLIAHLNGLLAAAHSGAQMGRPAVVRTRRLDWGKDNLCEKFDLILGADVIYDRTQWPALEQFWLAHLATGGMVLLGEPGRQSGDAFIDWIGARPWSVQVRQQRIASREQPVRLLRLTRRL